MFKFSSSKIALTTVTAVLAVNVKMESSSDPTNKFYEMCDAINTDQEFNDKRGAIKDLADKMPAEVVFVFILRIQF